MRYYTRVFGWLLVGMGTVLSLITAMALAGIIQLHIDFFSFNLDTLSERYTLVSALVIVAVAGLVLLLISKRSAKRVAGPAA
jgi:hypothetical protein